MFSKMKWHDLESVFRVDFVRDHCLEPSGKKVLIRSALFINHAPLEAASVGAAEERNDRCPANCCPVGSLELPSGFTAECSQRSEIQSAEFDLAVPIKN